MTNAGPTAPLTFIDNPNAPEVFATAASGFFLHEGNIHITFEALRVNHATMPGPVNRIVIGRLVMPLKGGQALVVGLYDFLKKAGLDPAPVPAKDKMQ